MPAPRLQYISSADAAKELGVIPRRVRALIKEGRLPASVVGKTYMIARADLDRFAASWQRKPGWPPGRPRAKPRRTDAATVALEDKKAATKERARRKSLYGRPLKRGPLLAFLSLRKEGQPASRHARSVSALAVMREATPNLKTKARIEEIIARHTAPKTP